MAWNLLGEQQTFIGFNRVWLYTLAAGGLLQFLTNIILLLLVGISALSLCRSRRKKGSGETKEAKEVPTSRPCWPWKTPGYQKPQPLDFSVNSETHTQGNRLAYFSLRDSPSRLHILIHLIATWLLFSGMAAGALIGLFYGPSLVYLPWLIFILSPVICAMDVIFRYGLNRTLSVGALVESGKYIAWFLGFSVSWMIVSMALLGVTYTSSAGIGWHSTIYALFLVTFVGRWAVGLMLRKKALSR